MDKKCILFAGAIGSGKSPIANYLSYKINFPVFNNDTIRTEIKEDLLKIDIDEYKKRITERFDEIIESEISFIYDASIDRTWPKVKELLLNKGYSCFIISLNFSKDKLTQLYQAKGYEEFGHLDRTFKDHEDFIMKFKNEVSLNLKDNDFSNRLEISFDEVSKFLNDELNSYNKNT